MITLINESDCKMIVLSLGGRSISVFYEPNFAVGVGYVDTSIAIRAGFGWDDDLPFSFKPALFVKTTGNGGVDRCYSWLGIYFGVTRYEHLRNRR